MAGHDIGGWGPRKGVTAWAFDAAGVGASLGVATAVVCGVMVFAASLPGAAVLVVDWVRRTPSAPWLVQPAGRVLRVPARPEAAPDA